MPAPIHTPAQRVSLRRDLAERMNQGFSQDEIALDLGISKPLLQYYWRKETDRWRKDAATSTAEHKARLAAQYDMIFHTAMADYLASGAEKEATTTRQRRRAVSGAQAELPFDQTTEASKRVQTGQRNPAFLDTALRALDRKAALFGLTQPTPVNVTPVIREISYQSSPFMPDHGRLTIIGSSSPALPEPDDDESTA